MDGHSLPIASHLTFQRPQRRDGLLSGSDPFCNYSESRKPEGKWAALYQAEAAFELMTGKVFPTESVCY